jgi:hypothetical protein
MLKFSSYQRLEECMDITRSFAGNDGGDSIQWLGYTRLTGTLAIHTLGYGTTEYKGLSAGFAEEFFLADSAEVRILVRDKLEDADSRTVEDCSSKPGAKVDCCLVHSYDSPSESEVGWIPPDE